MLELFTKVFVIIIISIYMGVTLSPSTLQAENLNANVIVIGGGLAGLTSAITLADRGATVIIIEKNPFLGGNSVFASSGINVAMEKEEVISFFEDTYSSSE